MRQSLLAQVLTILSSACLLSRAVGFASSASPLGCSFESIANWEGACKSESKRIWLLYYTR